MAWISYRVWTGPVIGAKLRVPSTAAVGVAAFGPSFNALSLRAGAIGTILNILPEGGSTPEYVKFPRPPNLSLAAEVRYRRQDNTPVMWSDFRGGTSTEEELVVVIPRRALDGLEIEYTPKS
jgi:hypothetical protein